MSDFKFYTSKELKPEGWLRRQLRIQADGLSGNLDKMWPDVAESAWIGGTRDGWERVPYWLDGFIPLSYLLGDSDMIERAKKYVNAIIDHQRESGWICPCSEENIPTYDTWPVLLISKALYEYYRCSGDERIPEVLYKAMKNYFTLLKSGTISLFNWAKYRWFEGFITLNFLDEMYGEPWIRELAEIIDSQGNHYENNIEAWKRPLNKWTFETHVVNLAMMLKTEAVTARLLNDKYKGQAEKLYSAIMKYNGTAAGIFTGDECLAGLSPIQGTELCAVAEEMYSCELLYAHTGNPVWAERLEIIAFNAFPASNSDDMWTHQYLQMSNQISTEEFPAKPIFRTNGGQAHMFGLEPNYGCCTANFNQAWPKFALSAFMHGDNSVISSVTVPCSLETSELSVELITDYPFRNKLEYKIDCRKDTTFIVRIPSFAENIRVNGKKVNNTGYISFSLSGGNKYTYEVEFDILPSVSDRPCGLKSINYGSLVFSLPISYEKRMREYERDGVVRKFPYCDYEFVPASEWQFGIAGDPIEVEECEVSDIPFSSENPPLKLSVPVAPIDWGYEDGYETVAQKVPSDTVASGPVRVTEFIPYGCAKLRITELPMASCISGVTFSKGAKCGEEELKVLNDQIDILRGQNYKLSFVCIDIDRGTWFSYNADWIFCSQSTIKAPYVLSLLDAKPEAFEENRDAIKEIITLSSNEDYENLRDKYGTAYIKKWCRKAGVSEEITEAYYPRNITVKDMAKLWTVMYSYLKDCGNSELTGWFTGSAFSSIYRALGDKYLTWTKAGWEEGVLDSKGRMEYRFIDGDPSNDEVATNDTGVVFTEKGKYILTLFTDVPADTAPVEPLVKAIDAVYAGIVQ